MADRNCEKCRRGPININQINVIACKQCKKAYHVRCLKNKPEITDRIQTLMGLNFEMCDTCEIPTMMTNLEENVFRAREITESLQSQFTPHTVEDLSYEISKRMKKMRNILIFNLEESRRPTRATRVKDDKYRIIRAISSFCNINMTNIWIKRLKAQDHGGARPVRVCLKNEHDAHRILSKRHRCTLNLRFARDTTSQERAVFNKALCDLQLLRQNGEHNMRIKYIRGVPRIVEITDPQPEDPYRQDEQMIQAELQLSLAEPRMPKRRRLM